MTYEDAFELPLPQAFDQEGNELFPAVPDDYGQLTDAVSLHCEKREEVAVIEYPNGYRAFDKDGTYTDIPFDPYCEDYPYNERSREAVHDKVWDMVSNFRNKR